MQEITIGEIIKCLRKEKGYSKIQLSQGLCSITALSRYEEDIRTPNFFLLEALFQRLGIDIDQYELCISQNDFLLIKERSTIEKKIRYFNLDEAKKETKVYQKIVKSNKNIHYQFIYFILGQIKFLQKKYYEAFILLEQALTYTKCQFLNKDIALLTTLELKLVFYISEIYMIQGKLDIAKILFGKIAKYIKNNKILDRKIQEIYYDSLFRIAKINYNEDNFGVVLQCIDELIEGYIEKFFLYNLKEVYILKLLTEEKMGILTEIKRKEYQKKIFTLSLTEKDFMEKIKKIGDEAECQDIIRHL